MSKSKGHTVPRGEELQCIRGWMVIFGVNAAHKWILNLTACAFDLKSKVNLIIRSQSDCEEDQNMSAPFIPASTALPFTSCPKGQRALTFGVLPSHWMIHDIDFFFLSFFFGQHTWWSGRLLFILAHLRRPPCTCSWDNTIKFLA